MIAAGVGAWYGFKYGVVGVLFILFVLLVVGSGGTHSNYKQPPPQLICANPAGALVSLQANAGLKIYYVHCADGETHLVGR